MKKLNLFQLQPYDAMNLNRISMNSKNRKTYMVFQKIPSLHIFSNIAIACLALNLSACGGGGGSSSATAAPPSGNTGNPNTPAPTAQSLQTHLSACPTALAINESIPCMAGLYEGKTTDTGTACAFKYNSNGVAYYTAGGQTENADLNILYSGAVFEKKAAPTSSGFAVSLSLGIASGHELEVWYQSSKEPASANGLLIKPKKAGMPACLVESGPTSSATGGESTANLLGKTWQSPQVLNGGGAVGLFSDQPGFDAGLADDGRAVITFRQPDASGRMAVYVVEGIPGATGEGPVWTAPQQLDASAPLLTGNYRPRIAVSSTGHAVVSWLAEQPCGTDSYLSEPAGKTCRYLYASRRLASDVAWETAKRILASPPMNTTSNHYARINARGDVVLAFTGFYKVSFLGDVYNAVTLATRQAAEANYRVVKPSGFWSNSRDVAPFSDRIFSELDDVGSLFMAGKSGGPFDVAWLRTTSVVAPDILDGRNSPVTSASGSEVFELRTSGNGFAAFTWRNDDGSRVSPAKLSVYSPTSQAWLAPYDIKPYTLWGNTNLVGTDNPDGEFLLYSACKLTAWKAGTWGTTRNLPAYCGRDQAGGVYAYNRKGDYLGINWAGKPGQWGYYSYAQDKMLKGAPGNASAAAGDLVLGTAADLFAPASTQLLLSPSGLALAVTTNTFTTLPSAANPAGVTGGAAGKLWAVYLK
jgi:hypothetical protein